MSKLTSLALAAVAAGAMFTAGAIATPSEAEARPGFRHGGGFGGGFRHGGFRHGGFGFRHGGFRHGGFRFHGGFRHGFGHRHWGWGHRWGYRHWGYRHWGYRPWIYRPAYRPIVVVGTSPCRIVLRPNIYNVLVPVRVCPYY